MKYGDGDEIDIFLTTHYFKPLINPEIFVEISHLTYRELYEVKVVTQPVKIIYT